MYATALKSKAFFCWCAKFAVIGCIFVVLPSIPFFRNIFATPLVLHEPQARGKICYVLDGGGAIWERLDAASDLLKTGRVSKILLQRDDTRGRYCFKAQRALTGSEWRIKYLLWRGVEVESIGWISREPGLLGTWTEARTLGKNLAGQIDTVVIVSSAPHMRRAVLAFRTLLPTHVKVVPYAASTLSDSYEFFHPIWLEYLKLSLYQFLALLSHI
ncbi:hypothetical protein GMLC_01230 [Geomonas limicola]|uniref:DUF218 domain-containing protein n=1 Tax=Geomonas limicola TaxID=2740186 RepID=A0A6V8N3J1_9BACT|nr:YdcF family protein [Geomonas limicola]GFO66544.1 hypothetical protein GMLC_01230 [Geomonas limicola]